MNFIKLKFDKKARFVCSKSFLFFFSMAFVICFSDSAAAFDIHSYFALPEYPIAVKKPDWATASRQLKIGYSVEEIFREWKDGVETSRFDGSRTKTSLRYNINGEFGINYSWQPSGDQKWFTNDSSKSDPFNLSCSEEFSEYSLSRFNRGLTVEAGRISTNNIFDGIFSLNEDIVAALGNNPGIRFENPLQADRLRIFSEGKDADFLFSFVKGEIESKIETSGIRMELEVPLKRLYREIECELAFKGRKCVPYLRYSRFRTSGSGESTKNSKFIFGSSEIEFERSALSAGLAFHGKQDFFLELSRRKLLGNIYLANNLITLDPLFLFGTNEVRSTINIPQTESFSEFRLGSTFRFMHRIDSDFQYGFSRLDLSNELTDEKIYNFRKKTQAVLTRRNHVYDLHRITLGLTRKDAHGYWKMAPSLIIPTEVSKDKEETELGSSQSGGSSGTSSGAGDKTSSKIRGGWQVLIERAYNF
ncbi:MAG: hypothetical protein HQM10_10190 [Candidatus Riflebacteria bacterium]|nr:hypothetical protein [Candidatus Riflebacteria bacterium]